MKNSSRSPLQPPNLLHCRKSTEYATSRLHYFEPKALDKQQMQGEAFGEVPFICLMTDPRKELSCHTTVPPQG